MAETAEDPAVETLQRLEPKREHKLEKRKRMVESKTLDLEDRVAKTLHKVAEIREKVKKLNSLTDRMVASNAVNLYCEIAVDVEQAICSNVLPEIFMKGLNANLHHLLNHLNDPAQHFPLDPNVYDRDKILCEARERWAIVCKTFDFPIEWQMKTGEWDVYDCTVPGDIRAIEVLKLSGTSMPCTSHISLKYAEENLESIKNNMAPWQFELVAAFIGSLREKMTKSGLHHDYLLLD